MDGKQPALAAEPAAAASERVVTADAEPTGGFSGPAADHAAASPAAEVTAEAVEIPDDDALEEQADRMATGTPAAPAGPAPAAAVELAADPEVREALRGPGVPLEPEVRGEMEDAFGADLGDVRVHTSEGVDAQDALAFTVGEHIAFGPGRYDPGTPDGRGLLVHELTHVVQQRATGPALQAKKKAGPPKPTPAKFRFSVRISALLDSDTLLTEFVRQYRRLPPDQDAEEVKRREKWHWTGTAPVVTQKHVDQGFINVTVTDPRIAPSTPEERKGRAEEFKKLSPEDQSDLTAEVDKQFYETTRRKPGEKLGTSPDDKALAEYWLRLRDEYMRRRQALDALPAPLREVLFADTGLPLAPRDYEAALRVAGKLADLTPAELAEYRARTTATADDWIEFEKSIDRYLAEHTERRKAAGERADLARALFGLDEFYRRWRVLQDLRTGATLSGMSPQAAGAGLYTEHIYAKERQALDTDIKAAGYPGGLAGFEAMMAAYQDAFERETLVVARVLLDKYEHTLVEQEERYQDQDTAAALHKKVGETGALKHFQEADRYYSYRSTVIMTPEGMAEQAEASRLYREEKAAGETAVASLSPAEPLVTRKDFPREQLARAEPAKVQPLVLEYIRARRKDVADTRRTLRDHPKFIWQLDVLLGASRATQNIEPGSLYDKILQDRKRSVAIDELVPHLVLAVIALAAGLLSGGTGAVAVLGAGTALGIGAYQALDEFRKYEQKSSAYGAGLLSSDPSFAWVIVGVLAAGIDLAVFVSALRSATTLRPALEAFNESGDIVKLSEDLVGTEAKLREAILRAAEAEAAARAAWQSVFRPAQVLRSVLVPGAEEFGKLVYAVYLTAVRGVRELQVFVKMREAKELIGDIAMLGHSDLALLKSAYPVALKEADDFTAFGKTLGLADDEVRPFVGLRANTQRTVEQIQADMTAFKSGGTAGARGAAAGSGLTPAEVAARATAKADAKIASLEETHAAITRDIKTLDEELGRVNKAITEGKTSLSRADMEALKEERAALVGDKEILLKERLKNRTDFRFWSEAGARRVYERYQELRPRTPGKTVRDDVIATAGPQDVLGVAVTPKNPMTADHVVPVIEIAFMDNFVLLENARALKVLNHRRNLVGLCKSANSARQETPWSSWTGWTFFTSDTTKRQAMIDLEKVLRGELYDLIQVEYAGQLARGAR